MLKGPQHDSDDRETKTHSVCALHSSSGEAPSTGPALQSWLGSSQIKNMQFFMHQLPEGLTNYNAAQPSFKMKKHGYSFSNDFVAEIKKQHKWEEISAK